ncbi:MAG: FAD-dependent thymidylate synthase, partial [Thermoplasmataceae archaeon]
MTKKPFSNFDKNIFLINIENQLDRGALLSRYSRTSSIDIRDLYEKEFQSNEERGRDFYKRVFLEYGDESVAELVNVQMSIQNLSNIAVKVIEESRIGLSYLEKSSRYVRYDRKHNGRYLYMDGNSLGLGERLIEEYNDHCDNLFSFYEENYELLTKLLKERFPIEEIIANQYDIESARKPYESAIRARALDDLRFVLPASTLTNVGISGNARAFINLLQKLKTRENEETSVIADSIYNEL